ncbi:uncharacterized protein BT62DRAFT_929736 [Guyanagaster necrorhizus]|uniref:Uncharacterized protein n=1 Tax=Guyanagaster necrorhizus TaxID=856835 RepID=A0A9P7VY07_9AGAR|nr:uncharacterized protein BT62DRAFT_929736 [Guyanagaster necrorhizus MCA 3950]KAG7448647.1 hypothetical protein BT62DRAFT_929736 [Guyanagaster necrorhizus MCA 3950]
MTSSEYLRHPPQELLYALSFLIRLVFSGPADAPLAKLQTRSVKDISLIPIGLFSINVPCRITDGGELKIRLPLVLAF